MGGPLSPSFYVAKVVTVEGEKCPLDLPAIFKWPTYSALHCQITLRTVSVEVHELGRGRSLAFVMAIRPQDQFPVCVRSGEWPIRSDGTYVYRRYSRCQSIL